MLQKVLFYQMEYSRKRPFNITWAVKEIGAAAGSDPKIADTSSTIIGFSNVSPVDPKQSDIGEVKHLWLM